ncbi:HemK family protein methyltransferase [Rhodanobacter sp. MP7CTX1]|uniref:HemK family protein methyltransferase n=1 Tax=Rhodanobacter sp. MP7CTX1 TaxID=2723084 RepID=UPI00160D1DF4|nr:release factor glutamine methyltransferase [Rhodanobacter sp. MP7CTX1]
MNDTYRKLHDRLVIGLKLLPDKPEESPDSTLRALWHAATGDPRSAVAALHDELPELPANSPSLQTLEHFVDRRLAGEPLAHITGRQQFMGLEMLCGPQALIPRAETEQLARASIELLQQPGMRQRAVVIDVGTGCGNLAFAIAHHVPDAEVFGTDLSEDAIAFAKRNGVHLGLQTRVEFRTGDLLASFETPDFLGHVDLIVSNPPYIASAKLNQADMVVGAPPYIRTTRVEQMAAEIAHHEPRLAFDGGPFGVTILMRLIEDAPRFLRAGGWLAFEVGLGQGAALTKRLQRDHSFQEVRALVDGNGASRAILARRS